MVRIIPISKSNPQDTTAVNKFYAQAVATGKTDLERLAYLVSNQSTVREGDCYAVILSLVHNIIDELKQGRIVKLDKLGSFQIGVSSEGVASIEEVGSNLVKDVRVNFRPDQRLKDGINMTTVSFTKGS
ncbi:MAG: DNA-binding protein [Flavobacteriia bacterium]|nr:DNA-binding protein [Flavobacteriia bacterium]OIP48562.1 MAG: DNA-binding protein [Flavobacteriaceae bacterium CG2_30_31_66]PIV97068.1 MAG: DNA-binding protein [Flavobacteriaceae bacterium CG17_big_fil_post_rev_8_21_14_2_50_31_13]PIX13861.1 MAG: DNA-binding protein [Flavobacteriaceae bacterium CG_4_8_14_3_um_filter_31_8]PIY13693.1 MAG: DNA-binding protein [Flavobacteriaceae bacterium CG_4_10_14_3_um_filter_31_253]PIZ10813.1 MAG: DNA-binding protein [Flavobacteriaceae bacterium CG_4_10_14_0_